LLWAPVENGNYLVISKMWHSKTCAKPDCPICGSYGALDPGKVSQVVVVWQTGNGIQRC